MYTHQLVPDHIPHQVHNKNQNDFAKKCGKSAFVHPFRCTDYTNAANMRMKPKSHKKKKKKVKPNTGS